MQRGASPGNRTNKRAREDINVPAAPSSPSTEEAVVGRKGSRSGGIVAAEGSLLELDSVVKTEAQVRISCTAEPSEARGKSKPCRSVLQLVQHGPMTIKSV